MKLIDTHVHLDDESFDEDRESVIKRAKAAGLGAVINVGINMDSSRASLSLAREYNDFIHSAVGVHPHEAVSFDDKVDEALRGLAQEDRVIAIGEIGLDYHYDFSPRQVQQAVFKKQLNMAIALNLPVIIHNRESDKDMKAILREEANANDNLMGVLHCYSGGKKLTKAILDAGFYMGIGGIVTFAKADNVREIVEYTPSSRIIVETDCPYLAPRPYRGKRCEPMHVKLVAEKLAEIKNMPVQDIIDITTENAGKLFNIQVL